MKSEHQRNVEQAKRILLGQPLESIRKDAEAAGWIIRVMRDGETRYVGDCAYRPNRINVQVDDGIITGLLQDYYRIHWRQSSMTIRLLFVAFIITILGASTPPSPTWQQLRRDRLKSQSESSAAAARLRRSMSGTYRICPGGVCRR